MPYVNIKITREGVTKEQKAQLIEGATQLLKDVLKESLIKSIKFCWLTRHQILGVVFENGCSLRKNHNNGVDAL